MRVFEFSGVQVRINFLKILFFHHDIELHRSLILCNQDIYAIIRAKLNLLRPWQPKPISSKEPKARGKTTLALKKIYIQIIGFILSFLIDF